MSESKQTIFFLIALLAFGVEAEAAGRIRTENIGCEGIRLRIEGHEVKAGVVYRWYKNESLIASATSDSYTATAGGSYYAIVDNTASGGEAVSSENTVVLAAIPNCTETFTGEVSTDWYDAENWDVKYLPGAHIAVQIDKPCEVGESASAAQAKSVKIHTEGGYTGSLTIQPKGRMIVEETIARVEGEATTDLLPTETSDLTIETGSSGNGVLVIGSHDGTNKATVGFYTKAKKKEGHNVNQFIGTPFNDENDIFTNYYGTKIYEFRADGSGDKGAMNEWLRLPDDGSMKPFYGYNILTSQATERTLRMEGTLAASEDQALEMYYNGSSNTENMFANSWSAPIDIAQFRTSDFGGGVATIYIFNAGTTEDFVAMGDGSAGATAAGQYIVLPIASAPWINPAVRVIPSMQAFSVFATASDQTLTLKYDRLVRTRATTMDKDSLTTATRSPRREAEESPEVMHLRVDGVSGAAANMHVLARAGLTMGFDNGWDGPHMAGDEAAPQVYAITEAGKMNVHCVPSIEGTVVGFHAGDDSQYIFSFGYAGTEEWYLNDQKAQQSTRIASGETYAFTAEAGDTEARFVISKTPLVATGVETVSGERLEVSGARKLLIHNTIYIIREGRMYSAEGQLVR